MGLFSRKPKAIVNRGTRIYDMESYRQFLMQQFMNSDPFVQYSFDTKESAEAALLELPFINREQSTGLLACSEMFTFGVYRDENTSDPEFGKYNAIVAGKSFSKVQYDKMCSICESAGASKYGGIEPRS